MELASSGCFVGRYVAKSVLAQTSSITWFYKVAQALIPLFRSSLVVGKMWGASWKHCDIAEIGRHKTTDILTGSTKELTDHLCCTKTAGVDQWKIDICFPPESGVRGVSGL
jgi:hypothetical protein